MSELAHADSIEERRRAPRYRLTHAVKVFYGTAPADAQFGFTADVSRIGALLLLPRAIATGTELQVRMSLPRDFADPASPEVQMRGSAVVRRQIDRQWGAAVGIEIGDLRAVGDA